MKFFHASLETGQTAKQLVMIFNKLAFNSLFDKTLSTHFYFWYASFTFEVLNFNVSSNHSEITF